MIIVTGANGQLGRGVVEELLKRIPATRIGVSVRDPEKAQDLGKRGVRVRQGDFDSAASLSQAFEGAEQVLIISSNSSGEQAVGQHRAAIDAAKAAGARRILYTSHVGASPTSPFGPMPDHAATEAALRESGVAYTVLRNGFYATTVPMMLGQSLATGEVALPADGPVSWTTHADLAEATAILLTTPQQGPSTTINLTAAEAFDFQDVAALVSKMTGRPLIHHTLTDEEYLVAMVSRGVPERAAQLGLGIFKASRLGQFSLVDPSLGHLLGRPPVTLMDFLTKALVVPKPAGSA